VRESEPVLVGNIPLQRYEGISHVAITVAVIIIIIIIVIIIIIIIIIIIVVVVAFTNSTLKQRKANYEIGTNT